MPGAKFTTLGATEKKSIVKFISKLTRIAKSKNHIVSELGRKALILAMWRWTADGVTLKTGRISQDRFKYSGGLHATTQAAMKILRRKGLSRKQLGKLLCHEHVVPRKCLADIIIQENLNEAEILRLLEKCCFAAIIEKSEAEKLERERMPAGWNWRKSNPFARYSAKRIKLIHPPERRKE